jgi:hypothetical protein
MKIYFSAALSQYPTHGQYYLQIIDLLERQGHQVFHDVSTILQKVALAKSDQQRMTQYKRVQKWISQADIVVLEVSFPSTLNIGHRVSLALEKRKPVIALYFENQEPDFLQGLNDEKLVWDSYSARDLSGVVLRNLELAAGKIETRFNFFMEPRQVEYLERVSANGQVPRSVYLRKLIDRDMAT